jgi:hypothetical protein
MGRAKDRYENLLRIGDQRINLGKGLDRETASAFVEHVSKIQARHYEYGHHLNSMVLSPAEEIGECIEKKALRLALMAKGIIPTQISDHHKHLVQSARSRASDTN